MKTIDIEIALLEFLDFRQNLIVPCVSFGISRVFYNQNNERKFCELHECDILKLTKSGYATEYEIKISKSDLKADFKKKHTHDSPFIKEMYYVVPMELLEFAKTIVPKEKGLAYINERRKLVYVWHGKVNPNHWKWQEKEILKLAKLGAMRICGLKKNIVKLNKEKTK